MLKKINQWFKSHFNQNLGLEYRCGYDTGFLAGQQVEFWTVSTNIQRNLKLIQKTHNVVTYSSGAIYVCNSAKEHEGPCAMVLVNPFELNES